MKYLLIGAAAAFVIMWWVRERRKAVLDRMSREAQEAPTALVRCPACGVHAPPGAHSCG